VDADYFWGIVVGEKIILPSGTFMLPSKFGYIFSGRYPESNHA